MARKRSDYTRTFRMLESDQASTARRHHYVMSLLIVRHLMTGFAPLSGRLQQDEITDSERQQLMQSVNPALVLRNWLAQRAVKRQKRVI